MLCNAIHALLQRSKDVEYYIFRPTYKAYINHPWLHLSEEHLRKLLTVLKDK